MESHFKFSFYSLWSESFKRNIDSKNTEVESPLKIINFSIIFLTKSLIDQQKHMFTSFMYDSVKFEK